MRIQFDPNIQAVEMMAGALEPLLEKLVLVGGCAVGLLITDQARPPIRETIDVDLITEVAPLSKYYELNQELRDLGFCEDVGDVICRWKKGELVVDVMPTDESILNFTNKWYDLALKMAIRRTLPSGITIRHITAPLFIATKIESFYGRGKGDFAHHDIEDIVNVVDGRKELLDEVRQAPEVVRAFIEQEFDDLLAQESFVDAIPWHLRPDSSEQERVTLVLSRFRQLAGL